MDIEERLTKPYRMPAMKQRREEIEALIDLTGLYRYQAALEECGGRDLGDVHLHLWQEAS